MSLISAQEESIQSVILSSIRKKLLSYERETSHMPFHTLLLGKDRLEQYSFIQSLFTSFGKSIFEPVAVELAKQNHISADSQVSAGNYITQEAQLVIQSIMDSLISKSSTPNKISEIETIRKVCRVGEPKLVKLTKVDLRVYRKDGTVLLIDIKTVKPNIGEFKGFKRTLLEWVAAFLYDDPTANLNTLVAFPYNPYYPEPYKRWTMQDMYDLPNEIMVSEEFWNFLGGGNIYDDLLHCFEIAGEELREEMGKYFSKFTQK